MRAVAILGDFPERLVLAVELAGAVFESPY
jgi:hypothetical protein